MSEVLASVVCLLMMDRLAREEGVEMIKKIIRVRALAVITLVVLIATPEAWAAHRSRASGAGRATTGRVGATNATGPRGVVGGNRGTVGTIRGGREGFQGRGGFVTAPVLVTGVGVVGTGVAVNGAAPAANVIVYQNDICSLCSKDYTSDPVAGVLPCGHYFHLKCIVDWLTQNPGCPLCNVPTSINSIRTVTAIAQP